MGNFVMQQHFFFFQNSGLMSKLAGYLRAKAYEFETMGEVLCAKTKPQENLIMQLVEDENLFTAYETREISMLQIDQRTVLDERAFQGYKSLEEYYSLVKEEQLRDALRRNRLFLKPEPIIDMQNQRVYAYHLTVKWDYFASHKLDLYQLFKLTERHGMPERFDQLLGVEHFHQLLVELKAACFLQEEQVVDRFIRRLKQVTGKLMLKLTHLEERGDFKEMEQRMEQYRRQGVCFALGELGTGYSALVELSRLKPDLAVVNFGQLTDFYDEQARKRMMQALINITGACNIRLLVEGAQENEELTLLKEMGLELMQVVS